MSDEQKPVNEPKKKTAQQLLNAKLDDLTNEELDRRSALIRASKEEADLQDITERLADRQNKRDMKWNEFKTRGVTLRKSDHDVEMVQRHCAHKKGGRGNIPGGFLKGSDVNYSVIKHTLPTNQTIVLCTRCGKRWVPVNQRDFDMKSDEGREAYAKSKATYQWALELNTDNIDSSSITFQHTSEDNNVTAQKFVYDTMKPAFEAKK